MKIMQGAFSCPAQTGRERGLHPRQQTFPRNQNRDAEEGNVSFTATARASRVLPVPDDLPAGRPWECVA